MIKALSLAILTLAVISCTKMNEGFVVADLDSVRIDQSNFIYKYRLDLGLHGYSDYKLTYSKNSRRIGDGTNVFFLSNHIEEVRVVNEDSLLIVLSFDNYRLVSENLPDHIHLKISTP